VASSGNAANTATFSSVINLIIITTSEYSVELRSVASVSVCLSVCLCLTFESLDLESSFLVCRNFFRISW